MRRFVRHITLGIILLLSSLISFAQVTPVQVTPQLVPPYSLQVSEYYSGAIPKIQVLLINRDINQPTIQVKLKMTVESQNCRLRTKEVNTVPAITLTNGVPYYLTTNELQALFSSANLDFGGGLSEQQYNQTLRLPEGLYTFTFEAYEVYSGNLVSNKGFSMGWLTLADPPLLNTPSKGEEVTPTASQNIVFNWTPRHNTSPTAAYYTEYLFTLVEYNDAALSPEAAFASSNPILQKTVSTTSMLFSNQEPITTNLEQGKRYAWRVQAKAKSNTNAQEIAMFRNNGISEVHWFVYKNSCTAPQGITVNVQGQRATIEWQNNPLHLEWKVEYREQNNPKAEWFSISNTLPRVVIMDLKPSTNYEYRVGGACYVNQFTYSPLNYFSTANAPVPPVVNCGDSTFPALGTAGLQTLSPGDTIRAGSFVVKVGYSTGSGSFTGTGYVIVPWLMNAKVEVKFTNITMSTDYKLVSGLIETTYDPTESGIDDIDEYVDIFKAGFGVGDVITGDITADKTVDFIVQWPNGISVTLPPNHNNETGQGGGPITIALTPQGGGAATTYTVDKLPTTIKDKDGNLYQVDKAGNITQIGKAGGDALLKTLNTKVIDKEKAEVKFVDYPTKQVYAFDAWNEVYKKSSTFSKEYERIGDYYVSQKAIAPGQTDYLKAVVTITDQTIVPDSIKFVNGKGTIYKSTALGNNTYEIAIVGGPEKDAQEIYAVYKPTSTKTLNLGKVKVSSYPKKEYNIIFVPVSSSLSNYNAVKDSVNKVFNGLNIHFTHSVKENALDGTWDLNSNGLDVKGSGAFSDFTQEMKLLNKAFLAKNSVAENDIVLFVLNAASDTTILGDMPRGQRFGYVFTSGNNVIDKVVVHEIGHGRFSLKHVAEYGFIPSSGLKNVMNYPADGTLLKYQWDLCHDPAIAFRLFSDDEGSMYINADEVKSDEGDLTYKFSMSAIDDTENTEPDYFIVYSPTGIGYKILKSKLVGEPKIDQYGYISSFTLQANNQEYIPLVGATSKLFVGYFKESCIETLKNPKGNYYLSEVRSCKVDLESLGFIAIPNEKIDNVKAIKKFWSVHKIKLVNDNQTNRNDIIALLQQLPPLAITFSDKQLLTSQFDLLQLKKQLEDKLNELNSKKSELDILITKYYEVLREKAPTLPTTLELSSDISTVLKNAIAESSYLQKVGNALCAISTFFQDKCYISLVGHENFETNQRDGAAILQSLSIEQRKKILSIYFNAPELTSSSWGTTGPGCFWANFGEEIVVAMLKYANARPDKVTLLNMFLSNPEMLARFYKKIDNSHMYIGGSKNFDAFVKEIIKLAQVYDGIYDFSERKDYTNLVWNPSPRGFGQFDLYDYITFDDDYNMRVKTIRFNLPVVLTGPLVPCLSLSKIGSSRWPFEMEESVAIDPWKPIFLTLQKPDPSYFPTLPVDEASYPISIQMPAIAFASLVNNKTNNQIQVTADVVFTVVSAGSLAAAKNGFQFTWRATQLLIAASNTYISTSDGYNMLVRLYKKSNPSLNDAQAMEKATDLQVKWGILSFFVEMDIMGEAAFKTYKTVRDEVAGFNSLTNLGDDAIHLDNMRFAMKDFENGLGTELKASLAQIAGNIHSWFANFRNTGAGQWLTSLVSKQSITSKFIGNNKMQYIYYSKKYNNQPFVIAEVVEGTNGNFAFTHMENGVPSSYNKYSVEEPTDLKVINNTEDGAAIVCEGGTCGIVPGGCFTAGTLVHTASGILPIEKIKEGDMVKSYDSSKALTILSRVSAVAKRGMGLLRQVVIGKDTITATPNHRFLTSYGWQQAAQLVKGTMVFLMMQGWQTVDTVLVSPTIEDVYNIEVENTHNFYVGKSGVLVHNGVKCVDKLKSQILNKTDVAEVRDFVNDDALIKLEDEIKKLNGTVDDLGSKIVEIQEKSKQLGRKLTFPELQIMWERGNNYNRKANVEWGALTNRTSISEVHLVGDKVTRLDTWVPPGKNVEITLYNGTKLNYSNGLIISRKATTLSEIQLNTFKNYLKEVKAKYYDGKTIKSSKTQATVLKGDYFLEIPSSNIPFLQNNPTWVQAANAEGVVLIFRSE